MLSRSFSDSPGRSSLSLWARRAQETTFLAQVKHERPVFLCGCVCEWPIIVFACVVRIQIVSSIEKHRNNAHRVCLCTSPYPAGYSELTFWHCAVSMFALVSHRFQAFDGNLSRVSHGKNAFLLIFCYFFGTCISFIASPQT